MALACLMMGKRVKRKASHQPAGNPQAELALDRDAVVGSGLKSGNAALHSASVKLGMVRNTAAKLSDSYSATLGNALQLRFVFSCFQCSFFIFSGLSHRSFLFLHHMTFRVCHVGDGKCKAMR